jgi:hypothetical protein
MNRLSPVFTLSRLAIIASAVYLLSAGCLLAAGGYPVTPKAVASDRFRLHIDEQPVFVHKFKDVHYAHFPYPATGASRIVVTARRAFDSLELSPKSAGVETVVNPGSLTLEFKLSQPGKWVVTMDGREHLFILAEKPTDVPARSINAVDHGADASGKTISTGAIQKTIDSAPAGSTVRIPAGHYISGSLFIRSGITLFLDAGALLQASGDPGDFESVQNAFIVIEDAKNAALKGRGTIDGSGAYLRHLTGESGRLLAVRDSRDVDVEGVILRNSRSWNTHIIRSDNVTLRNVKVINDRYVLNTDGINPDSSRHVLIEDSFFYCGDDAVAVKSTNRGGRFEDVYDITVRNNVMLTKKSALKVGTETHAAEMKDIRFLDNDVIESDRGMSLYARDGTHMHNIEFIGNRFERPYAEYQQRLIDFRMTERHGLSRISDVLIKDNVVDRSWRQASLIRGLSAEHGISGVVFENLDIAGTMCRSADDIPLEAGPHAREISFKVSGADADQ